MRRALKSQFWARTLPTGGCAPVAVDADVLWAHSPPCRLRLTPIALTAGGRGRAPPPIGLEILSIWPRRRPDGSPLEDNPAPGDHPAAVFLPLTPTSVSQAI